MVGLTQTSRAAGRSTGARPGPLPVHRGVLRPPHYAADAPVALHRYLQSDFVPRFLHDLNTGRLSQPDARAWQEADRFGRYRDLVTLRQPVHRTFYLVSCEASCDQFGYPALDPQRIVSAGFVVRRGASAKGGIVERWLVEDGVVRGWQPVESGDHDPDVYRRLCANGVLSARHPAPAYRGEETYPLHTTLVRDAQGRNHTILYGYLPLGGSHQLDMGTDAASPFDSGEQQTLRGELHWPFGETGRRAWTHDTAWQVRAGRPRGSFALLLQQLVGRYHVGELDHPDNVPLERLLARLYFYDARGLNGDDRAVLEAGGETPALRAARADSLWDYLQAGFAADPNPLISWLAERERAGDLTHDSPPALPARGHSSGQLNHDLFFAESDATDLRLILADRLGSTLRERVESLPVPRYQQRETDVYFVKAFMRVRDQAGKERLVWGDDGPAFRVAAPFDPEASRPSLIQMPDLGDLRRGMAKGASFLMPPGMMSKLGAMKPDAGASPDMVKEGDGNPLGIGWLCSFSLPVLMICAMFLLSIMIALLNFVFWWIPWVRICLPFPKLKE